MNNQMDTIKQSSPSPSTLTLLSIAMLLLTLLIYTTFYLVESAFSLNFHLSLYQSFAASWTLIWIVLLLNIFKNTIISK